MTFIDELLAEAEEAEEQRRLELDKVRADQLLSAITVLQQQAEEIETIADREVELIEHYRNTELAKANKKIGWLAWNLEQFIRNTGDKTIRLPHGEIKLRLGRDKVQVPDPDSFVSDPVHKDLIRVVPESKQPDLVAIMDRVKKTGEVPTGVEFIPAEIKFHFNTITRSNNHGKERQRSPEGGTAVEPTHTAQAA